MEANETNTPTSTNDRPPDGICVDCGQTVEAYLRPAFLDMPARWLGPQDRCNRCVKARELRARADEEQAKINQAFRDSKISPRFHEKTFANFEVTQGTASAHSAAISYKPEQGGLIFSGPVGTGKTHLAAAISNRLLGAVGVLFISCPEFLLKLREAMNGRNASRNLSLMVTAKTAGFLVLDDIGTEKSSEWVIETLFILINHRYEFKLPTILTTNCNLTELEKKLGARITSRLVEMCRCIRFSGPDYRFLKRNDRIKEDQHDH